MWMTEGDEDEEYLLSELYDHMAPGDDGELRKLKKRAKEIDAVLYELRDDDKLVKYEAGSINKVNPAVFSDEDEGEGEGEGEDEDEDDATRKARARRRRRTTRMTGTRPSARAESCNV